MLYTIKRHCLEEPQMDYNDGDLTYFLYAYGNKDIPRKELRDMLQFLVDSSDKNATNEDLVAIRAMMNEIKHNSEVEVKYMNAMEHERQILARGIKQGIEQNTFSLIKAKLAKGKDISTIAQELETTENQIQILIDKISSMEESGN